MTKKINDMDYEKEYKKALDRARRLHSEPTGGTERIVCEQIFPELKESEDERIRKEILEHIQFCSESIPDRDKFIAWLEKQGEKKPFDYENATIKQKDFAPMQEPKFKVKYAGSEYNVFDIKDIDGVTLYGIEDEPNHIDYVNAESCEIIGDCAINVEQEEKFSDNVKPKFSVDEWVAADTSFDRSPLHIMSVSNPLYRVEGIEGNSGMPKIKYIDNSYHHYTIRDAKDGDLIYVSTEEKGVQAIFHEYKNGIISFHCYLCANFSLGGYMPIGDVELAYPLQKNHYKSFFAKMKEAGYKWDGQGKRMLRNEK